MGFSDDIARLLDPVDRKSNEVNSILFIIRPGVDNRNRRRRHLVNEQNAIAIDRAFEPRRVSVGYKVNSGNVRDILVNFISRSLDHKNLGGRSILNRHFLAIDEKILIVVMGSIIGRYFIG